MQSMIALNIWSRIVTTEVLDAMTSASKNCEADLLVSQVYAEQVHDLFDYGMNACDDQALVKNCIVELFLRIGSRPDLLQEGESVDTNVFKMFRRLLIQQIDSPGERSRPDIHKNLFSAETQITQGLTSLQLEALFLKFQRKLSYREVAAIMDLTIEQLRGQISKAVEILLNRKSKDE
jgi:DNA-directed RNA polymerase specialized sigma24 family protein